MEGDFLRLIEDLAFGGKAPVLSSETLREQASRVQALRRAVEERWAELPQSVREALEGLTRSWEKASFGEGSVLLEGGDTSEGLQEFLEEVSLLSRAVADRLEESDPALLEALRKALAEEGSPLEKGELSRLILEP
jgi:hypothetical protein